MLELILKLYVMAMANDVRSPLPHLFGPPGCGKSTVVEQAAELLGVNLHIINVARLSPLDVEGVQMPQGDGDEMKLRMLTATFWTQLAEGDIILLDEFLRGFPEVYNALLDILTSRRVGGFVLPKVFIIGASNSTVAYDKALEDRLLHLPVADIRKNKRAKKEQARHLIDALGLLPEIIDSSEMQSLMDTEVVPMYEILDKMGGKTSAGASLQGTSIRNLIGQGLLREIHSGQLLDLINANNRLAMRQGKPQYVVLTSGKSTAIPHGYEAAAAQLPKDKLSDKQVTNLNLNLQLIELEVVRQQKEGTNDDGDDTFIDLDDLEDLS